MLCFDPRATYQPGPHAVQERDEKIVALQNDLDASDSNARCRVSGKTTLHSPTRSDRAKVTHIGGWSAAAAGPTSSLHGSDNISAVTPCRIGACDDPVVCEHMHRKVEDELDQRSAELIALRKAAVRPSTSQLLACLPVSISTVLDQCKAIRARRLSGIACGLCDRSRSSVAAFQLACCTLVTHRKPCQLDFCLGKCRWSNRRQRLAGRRHCNQHSAAGATGRNPAAAATPLGGRAAAAQSRPRRMASARAVRPLSLVVFLSVSPYNTRILAMPDIGC